MNGHESVLEELYRRIDSERPADAVDLLDEACRWEFSLGERTTGGGREDFAQMISNRPQSSAHHELTLVSSDGTQDVVTGWLNTGDGAPAAFVATSFRNSRGLITVLLLRRSDLNLPA